MAQLFFSQAQIDRWLDEHKVNIVGDVMSLLGASFLARPALHIARAVADAGDLHDLVGRVKTLEQLTALGAETYDSSVLLGEAAYECEPGFVAEVSEALALRLSEMG